MKSLLDVDAVISSKRQELDRIRKMTMEERGKLIIVACETAAEIEVSRQRMGLPPVLPAPWPDSTWKFLAECAKRARER
jgi:hypothetical protein